MAEWLRSGLQIRAPRFDSGRGLQILIQTSCRLGHPLAAGSLRSKRAPTEADAPFSRIEVSLRTVPNGSDQDATACVPTERTVLMAVPTVWGILIVLSNPVVVVPVVVMAVALAFSSECGGCKGNSCGNQHNKAKLAKHEAPSKLFSASGEICTLQGA